MGKNLIQQKRGKGGPRYTAPSFRYKGKAGYHGLNSSEVTTARILDIVHCQGHSAPLIEIKYENGNTGLLQAAEGMRVGDSIEIGSSLSPAKPGSILHLKDIPEGTSVFNIESNPGDGGKFVRCSGVFAKIVTKSEEGIVVLLPSSKRKTFNPECRATLGVVGGGGRTEKPFLKAGSRFFKMKAKNKLWPIVSGTSMNSVNHPFGGRSSHAKGIPTQSARSSPPGRKVGKIAPKRTGRRKR